MKKGFHSNLQITYILRYHLRNNYVIITQNCWLGDKVQRNGEIRYGETFRFFFFLGCGFGGQSDRKWNWRSGNIRFSMKRTEQYSKIASCVKITQLFILFISYNTVKNVILSLFRIPMLYSVLVRLLIKILILFI